MLTFLQNFLVKSQNCVFTILLAHSFQEEDKNDKPQPKGWGFCFVGCVNDVHARKRWIFYKDLQIFQ